MPAHVTAQGQSMAREVGRFFYDLRHAFRASQAQIAQRLATRIDIVAALEAGQVRALPPWPETCRIVRSYAEMAGLDPRPALHSLEMLLQSEVYAAPAPPRRRGGNALSAVGIGMRDAWNAGLGEEWKDTVWEAWNGRIGRASRLFFAASVPVALVVLLTQTVVLEAAVAQLPPSVARIVRGAQNYVIVQFAPVRDGLRWIDVPDPRTRRADKLATTSRPQ